MLAHGTGAVIGFTGSHHGPKIPIGGGFGYLGAPFHEALWDELINKGRPPASALFEARRRYLAGAPYRTPFEQPGGDPLGVPYARAVEQKTFWSATCLGMGW
jgi:hypothetical protein